MSHTVLLDGSMSHTVPLDGYMSHTVLLDDYMSHTVLLDGYMSHTVQAKVAFRDYYQHTGGYVIVIYIPVFKTFRLLISLHIMIFLRTLCCSKQWLAVKLR